MARDVSRGDWAIPGDAAVGHKVHCADCASLIIIIACC